VAGLELGLFLATKAQRHKANGGIKDADDTDWREDGGFFLKILDLGINTIVCGFAVRLVGVYS
jgi:hypothetical protein